MKLTIYSPYYNKYKIEKIFLILMIFKLKNQEIKMALGDHKYDHLIKEFHKVLTSESFDEGTKEIIDSYFVNGLRINHKAKHVCTGDGCGCVSYKDVFSLFEEKINLEVFAYLRDIYIDMTDENIKTEVIKTFAKMLEHSVFCCRHYEENENCRCRRLHIDFVFDWLVPIYIKDILAWHDEYGQNIFNYIRHHYHDLESYFHRLLDATNSEYELNLVTTCLDSSKIGDYNETSATFYLEWSSKIMEETSCRLTDRSMYSDWKIVPSIFERILREKGYEEIYIKKELYNYLSIERISGHQYMMMPFIAYLFYEYRFCKSREDLVELINCLKLIIPYVNLHLPIYHVSLTPGQFGITGKYVSLTDLLDEYCYDCVPEIMELFEGKELPPRLLSADIERPKDSLNLRFELSGLFLLSEGCRPIELCLGGIEEFYFTDYYRSLNIHYNDKFTKYEQVVWPYRYIKKIEELLPLLEQLRSIFIEEQEIKEAMYQKYSQIKKGKTLLGHGFLSKEDEEIINKYVSYSDTVCSYIKNLPEFVSFFKEITDYRSEFDKKISFR